MCQVSLVIVTYRREAVLKDTLRQVAALPTPPCQVIVVDQGEERDPSEDLQHLQARGIATEYVFSRHRSITGARNVGISHALGDVVLFIDDDVYIECDIIAEHAAYYREDPTVSAVAGHVTVPGGSSELFTRLNVFRPEGEEATTARGCHMSIRADVLKEMGGFNVYITNNGDETELFHRLKTSGRKIRNGVRAVLCHLVSDGGNRMLTYGSYAHYQRCLRDAVARFCSCHMPLLLPAWLAKNWRFLYQVMSSAPTRREGISKTLATIWWGFRLGLQARGVKDYIHRSLVYARGEGIDQSTGVPLLT